MGVGADVSVGVGVCSGIVTGVVIGVGVATSMVGSSAFDFEISIPGVSAVDTSACIDKDVGSYVGSVSLPI